MIDYYKILSVSIKASEEEIKKSFRKLALIHHPDKNSGSKKSEEIFKSMVVAYETLIDPRKRASYDLKYNQFISQEAANPKSRPQPTYTASRQENRPPQQSESETANHKKEKRKPNQYSWANLRFGVFIILILLEVIYLFSREPTKPNPIGNSGTSPTTEKSKKDQELEKQNPQEPVTGELDFKKE